MTNIIYPNQKFLKLNAWFQFLWCVLLVFISFTKWASELHRKVIMWIHWKWYLFIFFFFFEYTIHNLHKSLLASYLCGIQKEKEYIKIKCMNFCIRCICIQTPHYTSINWIDNHIFSLSSMYFDFMCHFFLNFFFLLSFEKLNCN